MKSSSTSIASIGHYSPVPHEEAGQSSALDHALGPLHRFALRRIRLGLCVLADKTLVSARPSASGFRNLPARVQIKSGLILEKEIEWVERLSSLPEVREAVREGTRLTFNQPVLQRWKESQRPYFRSLVILDRRGRSVGGVTQRRHQDVLQEATLVAGRLRAATIMGGGVASRRNGTWVFGGRRADRRRGWGCVGRVKGGDREGPALDLGPSK